MSEDHLHRLKDLPTPVPRTAARERALAAAAAAFDEPSQTSRVPAQGNVVPLRQSHDHSTSWRRLMQPRTYAKVASLAAVLIGAPLALQMLRDGSVAPLPEAPVAVAPTAGNGTDDAHRPLLAKVKPETQSAEPPNFTGRVHKSPPVTLAEPAKPSAPAPRPDSQVTTAAPPPQTGLAAMRPAPSNVEPMVRQALGGPSADMPRRAREGRVAGPAASLAERRELERDLRALEDAKRERAATAQTKGSPDRLAILDLDIQRREAELRPKIAEQHRDRFEAFEPNSIKQVAQEPVSTFSLDVDTASYALVRRQLSAGGLPRKDSVRAEEMINYFPYDYAGPISAREPFRPQVTVVPSPWNAANKLVHIGIKGYVLTDAQRPRANLVLLVDISGSMQPADRLPLLKSAFRMLVDELKSDDTVAIVTYASGSDIRLKPTKVSERAKILSAIESLQAGGSTAGARGLEDAYRLAEQHFDKAGVNRIILGTDGDWNVGITDRNQLKGYIERKRATGIYLSILGVGMGNHNDALMQILARNGNGVAAYIDTLNEARKVLVEEASASIFPIATDVKVQIEFNPKTVSAYRLIGYEKRILRREDFNNDKVDAGDIGSGHSVTAIYEVTPAGASAIGEALRYGPASGATNEQPSRASIDGELGFLKLRYKLPSEKTSRLLEQPILADRQTTSLASAHVDVRFSIAVAGFAELLRGSSHMGQFGFDDVVALAAGARGADPYGYRGEFLTLVRLAKSARP